MTGHFIFSPQNTKVVLASSWLICLLCDCFLVSHEIVQPHPLIYWSLCWCMWCLHSKMLYYFEAQMPQGKMASHCLQDKLGHTKCSMNIFMRWNLHPGFIKKAEGCVSGLHSGMQWLCFIRCCFSFCVVYYKSAVSIIIILEWYYNPDIIRDLRNWEIVKSCKRDLKLSHLWEEMKVFGS